MCRIWSDDSCYAWIRVKWWETVLKLELWQTLWKSLSDVSSCVEAEVISSRCVEVGVMISNMKKLEWWQQLCRSWSDYTIFEEVGVMTSAMQKLEWCAAAKKLEWWQQLCKSWSDDSNCAEVGVKTAAMQKLEWWTALSCNTVQPVSSISSRVAMWNYLVHCATVQFTQWSVVECSAV